MPDRRTRRGPHPKDEEAFAPERLEALATALGELCWLLGRGYSKKASLKLVGDRHALTRRQRTALQRCAASDEDRAARSAKEVAPEAVAGGTLSIDGYNVLLTVEAALGGGVTLLGRDGALRDMASLSRHYRRVDQTLPALERLGAFLAAARCAEAVWYLDRPISNSGRLKGMMEALAAERGWPWRVELDPSPDRILSAAEGVVATADSAILDRCRHWLSLARRVVEAVPDAWVVDLASLAEAGAEH